MPVRKALGFPTIFNLLGPLSNPTATKRQLVGVYDQKWCLPIAEVFGKLGAKHVWVVHGLDGMDELTISGPSFVACYNSGELTSFEVTPEDANLKQKNISDLRGGDAATNSKEILALLNGKQGAYQDIVVLNAAATLIVGGKAESLTEGAELALQAINSRRAQQTLENLIEISNRIVPENK